MGATESLIASLPQPPAWMTASDGDWRYYVHTHDEEALDSIDTDHANLTWEKLWMRPIRASQAEDYGFLDDGCDDTVLRDPTTGRFVPRWCWIECHQDDREAEPCMGVRHV